MITTLADVRNNFMSENGKKTYEAQLERRIAEGIAECEARGMTRTTISHDMGFATEGSLSKWTKGHQTPGPENLAKLAVATGLSLDWLLAERGPMFATDRSEGFRLQVIGSIAEGQKVPPATLRLIQELIDGRDLFGEAIAGERPPGDGSNGEEG